MEGTEDEGRWGRGTPPSEQSWISGGVCEEEEDELWLEGWMIIRRVVVSEPVPASVVHERV